jgi:hypothetical protein
MPPKKLPTGALTTHLLRHMFNYARAPAKVDTKADPNLYVLPPNTETAIKDDIKIISGMCKIIEINEEKKRITTTALNGDERSQLEKLIIRFAASHASYNKAPRTSRTGDGATAQCTITMSFARLLVHSTQGPQPKKTKQRTTTSGRIYTNEFLDQWELALGSFSMPKPEPEPRTATTTTTTTAPPRKCENPKCKTEKEGTGICGRCRRAWYCSKECQTASYPAHREMCTTPSEGVMNYNRLVKGENGKFTNEGFGVSVKVVTKSQPPEPTTREEKKADIKSRLPVDDSSMDRKKEDMDLGEKDDKKKNDIDDWVGDNVLVACQAIDTARKAEAKVKDTTAAAKPGDITVIFNNEYSLTVPERKRALERIFRCVHTMRAVDQGKPSSFADDGATVTVTFVSRV